MYPGTLMSLCLAYSLLLNHRNLHDLLTKHFSKHQSHMLTNPPMPMSMSQAQPCGLVLATESDLGCSYIQLSAQRLPFTRCLSLAKLLKVSPWRSVSFRLEIATAEGILQSLGYNTEKATSWNLANTHAATITFEVGYFD
jgi:hypothetical protein